jgi:calmodulin
MEVYSKGWPHFTPPSVSATERARYISAMDMRQLREAFHHADSNHDGRVSLLEFSQLLQTLGAGMSDEELRIGFEALDTDGNGRIDFDEFARWWNDR